MRSRSGGVRNLLAAVACTASVVGACGPTPAGAIIGGTRTVGAQFPYFVSLPDGCGAALVAPARVLTAGHCLPELRVGDTVRVGGASVRRRILHLAQDPRLTAQERSKSFDPDVPVPFDAAIIELDAPVPGVTPIALATAPALYAPGALLTIVGRGSSSINDTGYGTLRRAEVGALADAECIRRLGLVHLKGHTPPTDLFDPATMLCTSDPDGRAPFRSGCYGDSGSPLVATGLDGAPVEVGIDDWGVFCGTHHGDPENYVELPAVEGFAGSPEVVWRTEALGPVRLTGVARVGRLVRCVAPRYTATPPTHLSHSFEAGRRLGHLRVVGHGASLRIPRRLLGNRLRCSVHAASAGGPLDDTTARTVVVRR